MSDWRRSCERADRPAIPADLAGAFADRTPIDWAALGARLGSPRERAAADNLRRLEALRGGSGDGAAGVQPGTSLFLRFLLAIATLQAALALAGAAVSAAEGQWSGRSVPPLLLTAAFAAGALLLGSALPRDRRHGLLLAVFVLAAGAFGRGVDRGYSPLGTSTDVWLRGIVPEALAPALLWRFAAAFPDVRRFARFDLLTRRAAAAAWAIGCLLLAANMALTYGVAGSHIAVRLGRDHPGNLFWHLFALAALPAVAAILARARRAAAPERRKATRFAGAIAAGMAPLFSIGLVRMALPRVNEWILSASGRERLWIDVPILAGLAAMPVLATLAVIVDGPLERRTVLPAWMCRRAGTRVFPAFLTRPRGPGRRTGHAERLTAALDRMRRARGGRELSEMLRRELRFGLGAGGVAILDPLEVPRRTAVARILEDSPAAAVDVSRDGPIFRLLPSSDRAWLAARGAALAAALKRRDGSLRAVVIVGARPRGAPFGSRDRWFLSTLLAGAASSWEALHSSRGGAEKRHAEPALECPSCGVVAEREPLPCRCGCAPAIAALPARLGHKFIVIRRLGSGGMGVVYLGRDASLDRPVALKTLPALADGLAARMQDEARAMAGLNHESLATIYGLEMWQHVPVLVVEYFPGGTLADRLARGPVTAPGVLDLGARLLAALDYMHARGVIHGDVKPGNIGIAATGAPKLLDFGLAVGGGLGGTVEYLPPEVLRGAPPGPASDLWGLSAVLLECCGGRARVPAALADFFARALAPAVEARFQSADEMRTALEAAAPSLQKRRVIFS